jgi:hypothetical protein
MESLYHPDGNRRIVERIMMLDSAHSPLWGKMSAAQMVAHSQLPLQVALGELKLKRGLIGLLFGAMAKRQMSGPAAFKQNLPTAPQFVIRDQPEFIKERNKLIALVRAYAERKFTITGIVHPFFGKMTEQEWDILQWKHLDHHLRQFGV